MDHNVDPTALSLNLKNRIQVMTVDAGQVAKSIDAKDKTLRQVMSGVQYSIDFYQRDYKWQTKQVDELVADLTSRFLESFDTSHVRSDVASYPSYFLGSIVLSRRPEGTFIVDGQQRLTTLTLLLIYLRNLQRATGQPMDPDVQNLIQSTQFGTKSFNMSVPERAAVISALYSGAMLDEEPDDVSSAAIQARYGDIEDLFPEECKGAVLPFFMDWLIERVQLVEISAYSDNDAYTVFETMNDRGLSLSPADMLKGYLLSNIRDPAQRKFAEGKWDLASKRLQSLQSKDSTNEFFRNWFRGQYAVTYGGSREDYERLGPEFHRWLRDNSERVGLAHSDDFFDFVSLEVPSFAEYYWFVRNNQVGFDPSLEGIYHCGEARIDDLLLLLAPVTTGDGAAVNEVKARVVARYLDIFYYRRLWASRNLTRPALKGTFVALARDIRGLGLEELTARLYAELTKPGHDDFQSSPPAFTRTTRGKIHRLLARLTSFMELEAGSGVNPYPELVVNSGSSRYDIEHIWPNRFSDYASFFTDEAEFSEYRNRLGSLLLIPHSFNRSYSDMPVDKKLRLYGRSDHHLLVASLASATYEHNPRLRTWLDRTGLPFTSYESTGFTKQSSDARTDLYRSLARLIWSPDRLIEDSGVDVDRVIEQADDIRESLTADSPSTARSRSSISVKLLELVSAGYVQPGDILIGSRAGVDTKATAMILGDGSLELESGERFSAPSAAAMALGLPGVINGWSFWVHDQTNRRLSDIRGLFLRGEPVESLHSSSLFDEASGDA
jgi:hypothetical protein